MPVGTDKNKTKQCPQKEHGPEDHAPPRLRTRERSFLFEQTYCCRAIQNYRPLDSICAGHLFQRQRLHGERLNRMLDAAKTCVCSVADTDVANCLFVAILLCRARITGNRPTADVLLDLRRWLGLP